MKTIQIFPAPVRQPNSTSTLISKSLKALVIVLLVAGSGFAFGQSTSNIIGRLDFFPEQFFDPITISDGCEAYISVSGPNSDIVSKKITVIKRGTYQYQLKVVVNSLGAWGTFYSEGGEKFNVNDELILITTSNLRVRLRFLEVTPDGVEGSFAMNTELLEKMSKDPVTTLFIKNNVKNQMLKFTLNEAAQLNLQSMMNCIVKMK
jgi:hypothetical protein